MNRKSFIFLILSVASVFLSTYFSSNLHKAAKAGSFGVRGSFEQLNVKSGSIEVNIKSKSGFYLANYSRKSKDSDVTDDFLLKPKFRELLTSMNDLGYRRELTVEHARSLPKDIFSLSYKMRLLTNRGSYEFEVGREVYGSSSYYVRYLNRVYVSSDGLFKAARNIRSNYFYREYLKDLLQASKKGVLVNDGKEFSFTLSSSDKKLKSINVNADATVRDFLEGLGKLKVNSYVFSPLKMGTYIKKDIYIKLISNPSEEPPEIIETYRDSKKGSYFIYLPSSEMTLNVSHSRLSALLQSL